MPTPSTRIPARRTPAPSSAGALARSVEPVSVETFLDDHWERLPLVVDRGGRSGFDDLLSVEDVERLITSGGLRHPAFRLAKAGERLRLRDYSTDISWRPEPFAKTANAEAISAAFADGATIVVQGMHHWWPALSVLLPRARGRARPSGAGERLLHAARLTGPAGAPRHPRRVRAPGRRREALARLRAGAGAAAPRPALRLEARRARRARARRRAPRRRHDVPAARVAAPGGHVPDGLAPPDDRRERLHLDRGAARRARRVRGRRRVPALRPGRRRGRARPARGARRAARAGRRRGPRRPTASWTAAARSSTGSSRSSARSTRSAPRPASSAVRR